MRRLLTALPLLLIATLAVPASAGAAAPGGFKQLANPLGCLQTGADGTVCTTGRAMSGNYRLTISPDGKNVYATGRNSNTLLVFDRNATTGAITQKPGQLGCFVDGADTADCKGTKLLNQPVDLEVSPDGDTVWVAALFGPGIAVFTRNTTTGTLQQKTGLDGCVADNDVGCRDGRALGNPWDLAVSANGANVYVVSASSAVTAFAATGDGVLTQLDDAGGFFGCIQNTPTVPENCQDGRALQDVTSVDITPNSQTLYAGVYGSRGIVAIERQSGAGRIRMSTSPNACYSQTGVDGCTVLAEAGRIRDVLVDPTGTRIYTANEVTDKLIVFDRQTDGGILRHPGTSGCISEVATAGCTTSRGLAGAQGLAMSPDRAHVYLASQISNSVVEERVVGGGGLSPRADPKGCAYPGATNVNCTQANAMNTASDVKVSPDGRFIYVSAGGSQAISVFRRDSAAPVCQNASASITAGQSVRLTLPCSDADGTGLTRSIGDPPALGSLGAINQGNGQVTFASSGVAGTSSFQFRARSNDVDSNTATFTLNVTGGGGGGGGGGGPAPPPLGPTLIPSTVTNRWLAFPNFTKSSNLSVNNLPAGATVRVTCKTKKKKQQKKGCPYKSRTFRNKSARAKLNLRKPFRNKRLPVGTKISVTITAPNMIGKRITYTVRRRAVPKVSTRCLPPGGKARRCV